MLFIAGTFHFATATAQEKERTFAGSVSVEQVLVPVVVSAKGRFVDDLERKDFRLYVDGLRAPIVSFERSNGAPVHTLLLQDLSGSIGSPQKLAASHLIVRSLLDTSQAGDRYSLATFASAGVVVEPEPAAYKSTVLDWMAGWQPFGRTGIHDAVSRIPNLISADSAWRGAVLLVTDGVDNASEISPSEARAIARQAELPVHVFALAERPTEAQPENWSSEPLRLLSWVTGGQFHSIDDPATVTAASEAFMRQLRSQYILGFPTSGVGRVKPRKIRVEVRGKRRKVSFRREYLGTGPGKAEPAL